MLEAEVTKKHAGVVLWGDIWVLQALHELLHRVNEESPIIEDKEGFFLGLAYDIRKAYEGQRKKGVRRDLDEKCTIWGVEILWPVLIPQVGMLRASLAFIPNTRRDQALVYELEAVVESAVKSAMPGKVEEIMGLMHSLGMEQAQIKNTIDSRCLFFLAQPPRERMKVLPGVLESMTGMYSFFAGRNPTGGIPVAAFEKYEGKEWPMDIQW